MLGIVEKETALLFFFFFQMYLQQANQKDMIFNVIAYISVSNWNARFSVIQAKKKKKILLFQICNDIYFIKHQMQVCSYKISNVF